MLIINIDNMSLIEKSIMLHIDSHERVSGEHQDGFHDITQQLGSYRITEFDSVCCMSMTMAKSHYTIEDGFNTFQVQDSSVTGFYTIEIRAGTYKASQFRDRLKFLLNQASLAYGDGLTYNIFFSTSRGKYEYSVTGNTEQPIFKTTINIWEQLGFNSNTENQFVDNFLESTTVINMSPENNLMLRSTLCEGMNNNENIMQDLHLSQVPPFAYYQFYQHDVEAYSKGLNTNSTIIRFYLTNEDSEKSGLQRTVQLNNINWVANILLYKKSTLPQMIKNDIKLNAMKLFNK